MKRKRPTHAVLRAKKARKLETLGPAQTPLDDTVLRISYPVVQSLRSYLLSSLSPAAKKRRRYIAQYGIEAEQHDLAVLLDTTLVGCFDQEHNPISAANHDLQLFSQRLTESTPSRSLSQGTLSQSEVGRSMFFQYRHSQSASLRNLLILTLICHQIIDFVIWSLFRKYSSFQKPPHILCHGFVRSNHGGQNGLNLTIVPGIPGLVIAHPNQYFEKLKTAPWSELPTILGKNGDKTLIHLIQECGIFVPLSETNGSLNQVSGKGGIESQSTVSLIDLQ